MFEILTLKQTKKTAAIPIILFDESFWRRVVNFEQLLLEGTIREEDLALFRFASTPETAWEHLERHITGGGAPCHAETI
jgi:predicted Rossmann-fold nucleotide-binding protein